MTITNHALAGALLSTVLPWPVAVPLAVLSHFVLDALPHYGIAPKRRNGSPIWKSVIAIDIAICIALIVWALRNHHYALYICGQLAVAPDFVWVYRAAKNRSFDFSGVTSRYERWHIALQRYEFPNGLWVEVPLASILLYAVLARA